MIYHDEPLERVALRYWRLSRIKAAIEDHFLDRPFHRAASLLLDLVTIKREECLEQLERFDRRPAA